MRGRTYALDESGKFVDDSLFWERLEGMHPVEAIQCLNQRRQDLISCRLLGTNRQEKIADKTLSLINEKIREINTREDKFKMSQAVKAVFGRDGLEAVLVWMEQQKRGLQ